MEAASQETGQVTGIDGDSELANLFQRAQGASRKGAEQGKDRLRKRLAG